MEESGSPLWEGLGDNLKLLVISKMDYETRRLLRSCSQKDKHLVEMLPWRKELELDCAFCSRTGRWICTYYTTTIHLLRNVHFKEFFKKSGEAHAFMKEFIKTAEAVKKLSIESTLKSRVILTDGWRLMNVRELTWKFIGTKNNESREERYKFLFNQINLLRLKFLNIDVDTIKNSDPMLNDSLFELERTEMNLDKFDFSGWINNEQFLGLRAKQVCLKNCNLITSSAFVRFIKRMILQPPPRLSYQLQKFSSEFQLYFFGTMTHEAPIEFLLNVVGSDLKLNIIFYSHKKPRDNSYHIIQFLYGVRDDEMDNQYPGVGVDIQLVSLNECGENPYDVNTVSLRNRPSFHRFITAISEAIPLGFPLMRDLRN